MQTPNQNMKAILAKAIRQILFVAGGAIGAKSTASDSDIEAITGAVMIVASLAWSWFNEWRERKEAAKVAAAVGLLALMMGATGCTTVAPGSDPYVVRAEQTINVAFETVNAFLQWEYNNRVIAPKEVQDFAEALRFRAPDAFRSAKRMVRTYKYNRTSENKANADTAVMVITQLINEVNMHWVAQRPKQAAAPVLPIILMLLGLAQQAVDYANKLRAEAARNKELTPEEEAEIDSAQEKLMQQDHWLPKLNK